MPSRYATLLQEPSSPAATPEAKAEVGPVESSPHASKPQSTVESNQATKKDSQSDRYHDINIDTIRKAVRFSGEKPLFLRLTAEEKQRVADLAYQFSHPPRKTTETEIVRIALNYLLEDFRVNTDRSVLVRVLSALLS